MQKNEMNDTTNRAGEQLALRNPLVILSTAAIAIEKVRVMAKVRLSHLEKRGNSCEYTEELLTRSNALEQWVDKTLAQLVDQHPAAPWLHRVKGTGGEAIGKVLGHIENFGKFYEPQDLKIPSYVTRKPMKVLMPVNGEFEEKEMVWVSGIERFTTPSKLRKYAGLVPGQRRTAGKKIEFNGELRVMLFRLATSLLRAQGKYAEFYNDYKNQLVTQLTNQGVKVIPTPKGRWCPTCEEDKKVKDARYCPNCGNELSLKTEPDGVRYQGHIHLMTQRRMIQLFLSHLWTVWREALSLPLRQPYPIEYLGHSTIISPWDMVDK